MYRRALPTPPASCDWSPKAAKSLLQVYDNDQLGDCVIAGGYHTLGVETGNASAGSPFIATEKQILSDYSAIGGYVPGDPSTDNGCEIPVALDYWQKTGFADGSKLLGSIGIDATDPNETRLAMWLFENLVFGIALPDEWIDPFPSSPGFVWDVAGDPDPENGHCVVGVGYNADGVTIATWGMLGVMTWAAVAKYAVPANGGELHAALSPDQIAKGIVKAPNGLAWVDIIKNFDAMGGNVPVPAPPPPAPSPKQLTLAQAQAALAAGWPK
jgi:hypothetical protein